MAVVVNESLLKFWASQVTNWLPTTAAHSRPQRETRPTRPIYSVLVLLVVMRRIYLVPHVVVVLKLESFSSKDS